MVGYGDQTLNAYRLTVAGLAVVVLVMIVGFTLLYSALSSLRGEVSSISRSLEDQAKLVGELQRQISAQAETLRGLEELRARVESVERALGGVASARDLERLAEELGRVSAQLRILEGSVGAVNESLRSSLRDLLDRVEALTERVNVLAEQMLFPVTVVDGVGDKVVILRKPSRIVSLAPSVTETLYYIGALEALVAVDPWSDFPQSVRERRERGELATVDYWSPSAEAIAALKPDLVIGVASVPSHRALKSLLSQYGIPVILLPDFKLSDVVDSLLIAGRATGRIVEAYETVYKVELAINYASLLVSKAELKPRIAAVVWVKPLFVVGGGTWEHDILELVGYNVYRDLSFWPQISPESMLERAPEVIVMTSSHEMVGVEDLVNTLLGALGDAAYKIPALRDGRIYVLTGDYENAFVRPSPRTIIAIYVLLAAIHPQLFNLSPAEIPRTLSLETLDIIRILERIAPDPVVEMIRKGLKG